MSLSKEVTEFWPGQARLDYESLGIDPATIIGDTGVDGITIKASWPRTRELLPPRDHEITESRRFGCADCAAAQACDSARRDANRALMGGLADMVGDQEYGPPDSDERARAEGARAKQNRKHQAAIDDFEAATEDGSCPGGEIITVETTYTPWDSLVAPAKKRGRLRRWLVRSAIDDNPDKTAVHTSTLVKCNNPQISNVDPTQPLLR